MKSNNYQFKITTYNNDNNSFGSLFTKSFVNILNYLKLHNSNESSNKVIKIEEETERNLIWSSPGGFVSQASFLQKCKTTVKSLAMLEYYDEHKNLLVLNLIEKYISKEDLKKWIKPIED